MPSTALFRPTYRLVAYSFLVGLVGAVVALGFDALVDACQELALEGVGGYRGPDISAGRWEAEVPQGWQRLWLPLVTTLGGLLSGFIVYRWAPEAEGHGTDAAIETYHLRGGEGRARTPFIKALTSALTIGSGGVAGREGPTAQIAVGLSSLLARGARLRGQERRSLLLAGMAAGLSAMFRAPLGMAIFSVEILYSGMVFEAEALIYTVIAAVTAYAFYGVFAGWSSLFTLPGNPQFEEPSALLAFALLGVSAGLLGAVLPALLYRVRDLFRRLPGPPHIRPALGGLLVGLMALAAPEVLGTGYGWVELAMAGKISLVTLLTLLLLKGPAMALTIGSGGSGGVFAPTVTLGGMLGAGVGLVFQQLAPTTEMPLAAFVLVGMAAVFAGAARTPISTLIMVAEMTGGYGLIVPAMLANIVSFLVQRGLTMGSPHPTLYESQVESREDSPLHRSILVRRALELIDTGGLDATDVQLPRLLSLLRFGEPIPVSEGSGNLVAFLVRPGSRFANRSIQETIGKVEGATAVALIREGETIVPRGGTMIRPGDRLLAIAQTGVERELAQSIDTLS
jgi:CIC family chloride channel protein